MEKKNDYQQTTKSSPRSSNKECVIEENGEYGYMKNDEFIACTNFILQCQGIVEESRTTIQNGRPESRFEIVGYMVRAKPKSHREDSPDLW